MIRQTQLSTWRDMSTQAPPGQCCADSWRLSKERGISMAARDAIRGRPTSLLHTEINDAQYQPPVERPRPQFPKYSLTNLSTASLCFARSQSGARIWAELPNPRIQARNSSTPDTMSK